MKNIINQKRFKYFVGTLTFKLFDIVPIICHRCIVLFVILFSLCNSNRPKMLYILVKSGLVKVI
jgi:hypothetical protein